MKTLDKSETIDIPREVAVCPYCDADLVCRPEAWTEQDDGTWAATESGLECCAEPEIDSAEWDEWLAIHTDMPYVYWLALKGQMIQKEAALKFGVSRGYVGQLWSGNRKRVPA